MVNLPRNLQSRLSSVYLRNFYNNNLKVTDQCNTVLFRVFKDKLHNKITVPVCIAPRIQDYAFTEEFTSIIHRFLIDEDSLGIEKKTANAIVTELTNNDTSLLRKVTTPSGLTFYGNKYVFFKLDEGKLMPLMMAMKEVDLITKTHIQYDNVLYVDYRVFENNDLLSKFIIKKAIPFYTAYHERYYTSRKAIIEDLDRFFKHIPTPDSKYNKDSIYDSLSLFEQKDKESEIKDS